MYGMPPSRPRGCVQANYQQLIPSLQFTYCMNEVKKCFGKGFGWICALNRWSMQERAHNSNSSDNNLFGKRTVQTGNCFYFEPIDTLLLVWGVR